MGIMLKYWNVLPPKKTPVYNPCCMWVCEHVLSFSWLLVYTLIYGLYSWIQEESKTIFLYLWAVGGAAISFQFGGVYGSFSDEIWGGRGKHDK